MSDPFVAPPPIAPPSAPSAPQQPHPPSRPVQPPAAGASPQARRTAAIVVTSLGALLLAAAATVFMVIAWDRLRLPGKVGVVGTASAACLLAGHRLRTRLSGVAAVLTHLGAVLAPLVAGAGAVVLDADRPTVAVAGGIVGMVVLQVFDRMGSPILAAGRALACAGVAVGLGVWLDVSPALLLIVAAAGASLLRRWNESIIIALLTASTPLISWGAALAEPGSLLPWLNALSAMDQWLTSVVAIATLIVISAQVWQLHTHPLLTAEARWATATATAIFAINVTAFANTAIANPNFVLLALAVSVLAGRTIECLWARSIGRYVDVWTWAVTGLTCLYVLSFDAPFTLQRTELIVSILLLASWLLNDALGSISERFTPIAGLLHGSSGPMSSFGIAVTSISIAVATSDSRGSAVGLIVLGALFACSQRTYRADLSLAVFAAALTAAVSAPVLLPVVAAAVVASSTLIMLTDLRRGIGPRALQPLQWMSLAIAGIAVLVEVLVAEPTWASAVVYLLALAGSGVALSRFSNVPDLLLPPRFALIAPLITSFSDLHMAGTLAVVTGLALIADHVIHRVTESQVLGFSLLTVGCWTLAADAGVTAPEVYIALPCLILTKIGVDIVRRGGSSWVGLAPAIGLFTFVGILERVDGHGGWHAVAAGTVAIIAMVAGVDRRWAGPSLVGTLSLVAVVGVETAAYVPAVPLWIWLAVGGASLVTAGVYLERSADEEGTASLKTAWAAFR